MNRSNGKRDASLLGCLLGAAVGDSICLPFEGIGPKRACRMNQAGAKHRLFFGKGMFSDDTDHLWMVSNALILHPCSTDAFQKRLARSLRWWLAALPAGVGLSTAKAIFKLWLGFPVTKSGVFSAGNGAAMRSSIIGVFFCDDPVKRRDYVVAGSQITHTDPRAIEAAILTAEATVCAKNGESAECSLEYLTSFVESPEMDKAIRTMRTQLKKEVSVREFMEEIGNTRGVSGFAPETTAVALFAWLRHRNDFRTMINELIACGGDTDTVGAIAGGIAGAECHEEGIPDEWISEICDWPRSVANLRKTAHALGEGSGRPAPRDFTMAFLPVRNFIFLCTVLTHGFRRLLPPY